MADKITFDFTAQAIDFNLCQMQDEDHKTPTLAYMLNKWVLGAVPKPKDTLQLMDWSKELRETGKLELKNNERVTFREYVEAADIKPVLKGPLLMVIVSAETVAPPESE